MDAATDVFIVTAEVEKKKCMIGTGAMSDPYILRREIKADKKMSGSYSEEWFWGGNTEQI